MEAVAVVVVLLATGVMLFGLVNIAYPIQRLGVKNRWIASGLLATSVVLIAVFGQYLPEVPDEAAVASTTTPTESESSTSAPHETTSTVAASADASARVDTTTTLISRDVVRATTTPNRDGSTTSTQAVDVLLPAHEVVEEEDVSFPGAVRISLRVIVEEGTTKDQLGKLAWELADHYRSSLEYQAFNVFFYHYPEMIHDVATLGYWIDAPYGDWGRAGEVERGDYSTHRPDDRLLEKNWTLLPNQQEVDLYVAYLETFDEMDTGTELPTDEEVFAAVAQEHGVDPSDVEDAANAVLDWMFDG